MAKITVKEQVLQFVESKGSARFTDIQRFIVDLRYGQGTYDAAAKTPLEYDPNTKANPYRGYFCSAFSGYGAYFMLGENRLDKNEEGKYIVIRKNK